MKAERALRAVEELITEFGDEKALKNFYLDFARRLEVLRLVKEHCKPGGIVLDLGAQPFVISCALRTMGYEVIAYDIEPEPYLKIAESCGVKVVKCDLETDELGFSGADCAVFSEVLEHLHYYYIPLIMAKINRALKYGGYIILTTPNIASFSKRLALLLGRQPILRYHVREYTIDEVLSIVKRAGFEVVKAYFSVAIDLPSFPESRQVVLSYRDLIRTIVKRPTQVGILEALTYPIKKLIPSLRALTIVVAVKSREPEVGVTERWG